MEWYLTALGFVGGIGLIGLMNYIEHRRRKNFDPGLLPTIPFTIAGGVITLLAVAHFLTMFKGYR